MRRQVAAPVALEGVREVRGRVDGPVRGGGDPRELLAATHLRCQKGGREHDALDCLQCARFVNYRPAEDLSTVTVRCQWRLEDPITDLMTMATVLDSVREQTPVGEAAALAQERGHDHLLVTRGDELVGIVCRCDLAPPIVDGEMVSDRMKRNLVALPVHATLRDAAVVMTEFEVGCLPVVDEGGVHGVVTRGDLRRAGIEGALLGARRCGTCGGSHGVRRHPTLDGEFCLDCYDRGTHTGDGSSMGSGD